MRKRKQLLMAAAKAENENMWRSGVAAKIRKRGAKWRRRCLAMRQQQYRGENVSKLMAAAHQ